MNFTSVNELERFEYSDCRVLDYEKKGDSIVFEVEALIIGEHNSQNARMTRSYSDITQMRFTKAEISKAYKEGFKYYDANGKLQKEVPDEAMDEEQIKSVMKTLPGTYLYIVEKEACEQEGFRCYSLTFEVSDENSYGTVGDSYRIYIQFEDAVVEWDRYMNKA